MAFSVDGNVDEFAQLAYQWLNLANTWFVGQTLPLTIPTQQIDWPKPLP